MLPLLVPSRQALSCSRKVSYTRFFKFQILQQLSRKASSTRAAPRKHASSALGRSTPGAFRPELLRFLNKEAPTILVETRSPIAYKIGMFMLGSFCISYSIINYYSVLHNPPKPLNSFVRSTHSAIDIAMALFGLFSLYKTRHIISSISAVPYIVNPTTGQRGLMLRIQTYRSTLLPGRSRKITEIPADMVFKSDTLGIPGLHDSTPFPPTRDEKIAERLWTRKERRREHQENMSRLFTLPFREAAHWIGRGFHGLRDLLAGDGFVHLKAKGQNGTWKVSRDFDWALDNGHAFDKIVKLDMW